MDRDVDAGLGAVMALRARLIREDRLDDLVTLAERTVALDAPSRVESVRWVGGRLAIEFSTEVRHRDGTPFVFDRAGGRTALDPRLSGDLVGAPVDVTDEIAGVRLLTMMRERTAGIEWATSTKVSLEWLPTGSATGGRAESRLVFHAVCQVDTGVLGRRTTVAARRLVLADATRRVRAELRGAPR